MNNKSVMTKYRISTLFSKRILYGIITVLFLLSMLLTGCRKNETQVQTSVVNGIEIAEYSGKPYCIVNQNRPFFTEEEKKLDAFESYRPLDRLGRCGTAFACVTRDLMPTEPRGEIGNIKPSGWKQEKYPGIIDAKPPYLYNRCHLIAYCLTAENANERNLITGTRYMNLEGMKPFEDEVAEYLDYLNNHVLYRATPVFEGDNLVASGVLLEAYSVEDNGRGISFCVYCYNVQPGIEIDYRTGNNKKKIVYLT